MVRTWGRVSQFRLEASAANLVSAVWSSGAGAFGRIWSDLGHGDEQDQLLPKRKVEGGTWWGSGQGGRGSREYTSLGKSFCRIWPVFFCK